MILISNLLFNQISRSSIWTENTFHRTGMFPVNPKSPKLMEIENACPKMRDEYPNSSRANLTGRLEKFLDRLNKNVATLRKLDLQKSPSQLFRKKNKVSIFHEPNPPEIISSWADSKLLPAVSRRIDLDQVRPVQMQIIPFVLERKSISVLSETGSGKTLSYVIPYINMLHESCDVLLVIVPTKELTIQVEAEFNRFSDLTVCSISGGKDFADQRTKLRTANVIVATLGRLKEHLEHMNIDIETIKYLVVDEMDRIMCEDMEEDFMFVFRKLHFLVAKQMFSATKTFTLEKVGIKTEVVFGQINQINQMVDLKFVEISEKDKLLLEYLSLYRDNSKMMLIFCNKIATCEEIESRFGKFGVRILHGKKDSNYRESVLRELSGKEIRYLVCTDVAGRGVDFKNVDYVINYDFPSTIERFIHRAGRTGRTSRGICVSFLSKLDVVMYPEIRTLLNRASLNIPEFLIRDKKFIYD